MFVDDKLALYFNTGDTGKFAKRAIDLYMRNPVLLFIAESALSDDCFEFMAEALEQHKESRAAQVYLAYNSNNPNLIKIGMAKNSKKRERSLNTAGVVGEVKIMHFEDSIDGLLTEKIAHGMLANYHWQKEFYAVDYGIASTALYYAKMATENIFHNMEQYTLTRDVAFLKPSK